jgi:hypothetical protein
MYKYFVIILTIVGIKVCGQESTFSVMDFESTKTVAKSLANSAGTGINKIWFAEQSKEHATSGAYSLKLKFNKWQKGQYQWPGLRFKIWKDYKILKWGKYNYCVIDFFNPTESSIPLRIEFCNAKIRNGKAFIVNLPANKKISWVVPIDKFTFGAGALKTTDIARINIYLKRPAKDFSFFIDNIRLLKKLPHSLQSIELVEFETEKDIKKLITTSKGTAYGQLWSCNLVQDHTTKGKYSLCLNFKKWAIGQYQWPGMRLKAPINYQITSWGDYGYFSFDFFNPGKAVIPLRVEFCNANRHNGKTYSLNLPSGKQSSWKIAVNDLKTGTGALATTDIVRINIYLTRPVTDYTLFIDNIKLLRKDHAEDLLSAIQVNSLLIEYIYDNKKKNKLLSLNRLLQDNCKNRYFSENTAKKFKDNILQLRQDIYQAYLQPDYGFDFGSKNSQVFNNWHKITKDTIFSEHQAWGWKTNKSLGDMAQSYSLFPTKQDLRLSRTGLDLGPLFTSPISEDFVYGQGNNTFLVNLPAGKYGIHLITGTSLGNSKYSNRKLRSIDGIKRLPMDFKVKIGEEERTVSIKIPLVFKEESFIVSHKGGLLPINFNGRFWAVNSLLIYPIKQQARVKKELIKRIMDDINFLPPVLRAKYTKVPRPKLKVKYQTTVRDKQQGGFFFSTNYLKRFYKGQQPTPEQVAKPIDVFASPNETEPICLWFKSLNDFKDTILTITDLKSADKKIVKANIEIRTVKFLKQEIEKNGLRTRQYIDIPRLLVKQQTQPLSSNEIYGYWLILKIPANISPGCYKGKISLQTKQKVIAEKAIKVNIYDINKLQTDPGKVYGIYWGWYWWKDEKMVRQELLALQQHGFNSLPAWSPRAKFETNEPAKINFSIDSNGSLPKFFRVAMDYNFFKAPFIYGFGGAVNKIAKFYTGRTFNKKIDDIGLKQEAYDAITRYVKVMNNYFKAKKLKPLYYPLDEISDPQVMRDVYKAVKQVPGVNTYSTGSPVLMLSIADKYIDTKCAANSWGMPFFTAKTGLLEIKKQVKKGKQCWIYPNDIMKGTFPAYLARFIYGFFMWKTQLTGIFPWTYQGLRSNPYNDFDGISKDYFLMLPDDDSLAFTIQSEAIREGIDDSKYIYTLEHLLQTIVTNNTDKRQAKAIKIIEKLKTMKQKIPISLTNKQTKSWCLDNLEVYRRTIAQFIVELNTK